MINTWNKVSNIGLDKVYNTLSHRSIRLANRLNFVMLLVFVILLSVSIVFTIMNNSSIDIGSYRSFFMIGLSLIIMFSSYRKRFRLSRFLLVFAPPFLLILLPTLVGFVEEESFVYYPYVLIIMSLFPQLLILPEKERTFYFTSLLYYLFCVVTIDLVLIYFGSDNFQIVPIILQFYAWYKIIPMVLFLFLSVSIYYLRTLNMSFEKEVKLKNKELDLQNETLKTTIQELNKTQAKLIHSEKMAALGNLTSGIAHEINNPLNYIAGGAYILGEVIEGVDKNENISERLEKANSMIESGINRATRVVQLLSVFSEDNQINKMKLKVDDLIDGTLCFITVKTEGIIEIEKDYQLEEPIEVYQDQVHKVLLGVFENALEAILETKLKGQIKIKSYSSNETPYSTAIIEVWNSGPQIPVKNLARVFNPFFSTKNHKMNTGLGLTIGYNIIQEHGGEILVENVENGVLVTISLPLI